MNNTSIEKIQEVINAYGYGSVESADYVNLGVSDENYIVTTREGKFFLKKHGVEAGARIDSIEHVGSFFSSHGIPMVLPLKTQTESSHYVDESGCYVLYPFISGRTYSLETASPDILQEMGSMLARMHLATKNGIEGEFADVTRYFVPGNPEIILSDIGYLLGDVLHIQEKSDHDRMTLDVLALKQKLISSHMDEMKFLELGTFNLGHGDYHFSNVFFDDSGKINAIFDIDMAGPMPRVYDLVRAIMLSCVKGEFVPDRIKSATIMLKAYYDLYPFTKDELRHAIDLFFYKCFSIWQERSHYLEGDTRSDILFVKDKKKIEYLEEHRYILTDTMFKAITA